MKPSMRVDKLLLDGVQLLDDISEFSNSETENENQNTNIGSKI